jgi:hypothetical protein
MLLPIPNIETSKTGCLVRFRFIAHPLFPPGVGGPFSLVWGRAAPFPAVTHGGCAEKEGVAELGVGIAFALLSGPARAFPLVWVEWRRLGGPALHMHLHFSPLIMEKIAVDGKHMRGPVQGAQGTQDIEERSCICDGGSPEWRHHGFRHHAAGSTGRHLRLCYWWCVPAPSSASPSLSLVLCVSASCGRRKHFLIRYRGIGYGVAVA